MKLISRRVFSRVFTAAAAALLTAWAPHAQAQDITPELETWLQENALGPHAAETENWDDIVAKAKAEGEVIVYTSSGRIAKLVDDFGERYPGITLTVFDLGSDKTVEKTIREQDAGIFNVDLVTTGNSGDVIHELLANHRIFNYVPAHFLDRIPEENREPLLVRVGEAVSVFYNAEANPDGAPISNVWELTEPALKGKVGMKDPMSSGSTLMAIATLVQNPDELAAAYKRHTGNEIELSEGVPDAGYEFVYRLLKNDVVIFKSGSKLAAASGLKGQDSPLITINNMTYIARNGSDDYINALVTDLDPVAKLIYPTYMAIAARAPHPNAAKVLTAYLLGSPELTKDSKLAKPYMEGASLDLLQGLAPYFDEGTVSPRSDVPRPEGGEVWDEMTGWTVSADFMWNEAALLRDFWILNAN